MSMSVGKKENGKRDKGTENTRTNEWRQILICFGEHSRGEFSERRCLLNLLCKENNQKTKEQTLRLNMQRW